MGMTRPKNGRRPLFYIGELPARGSGQNRNCSERYIAKVSETVLY